MADEKHGNEGVSERRPLFPLGVMMATPGALDAMAAAGVNPRDLLHRHLCGDWGDLDQEDVAANNRAVAEGFRLLSCYHLPHGVHIWIITEADRSSTTILLPSDY